MSAPLSESGATAGPDRAATTRARHVALLVAVTFFMENLDATVITTALPKMAETFGVGAVDLNIGITAYIIAVAIFIPLSGWMADRFGARRIFAIAIAVFTLASLLCGLCTELDSFVAARVLQGIGGALMVPVGRLSVLRTTEKKDLVKMIALITWPGLVAPILGPPLGGLMVTYATWPWIFFVNIPLGLIAIAGALVLIPAGRDESVRPFDSLGFMWLAGACATIMLGLEWLGEAQSQRLSLAVLMLGVGVVLALIAIRHCRRHPAPLLGLDALQFATFRSSIFGGSLFRIAISALPFLLPLMFQVGFGLPPVTAGVLVLAVFAGNLLMKPFTTATMRRWGFRTVLLVNGVIGVLAILACALLSADTPWPVIAVVLFVGGLSRSLQFTCYNSVGFADVPKSGMSAASTLFSMFFQLAMGMGVAVGALLLRLSMAVQGHSEHALTSDFRVAFVGVAVIGLLALIDIYALERKAGEHVLER
jgi:EmrB/QacA subfamily drug resistance transporter